MLAQRVHGLAIRTHAAAAAAALGASCGPVRLGSDRPYLGNLGHRIEVLDAPPHAAVGLVYGLTTLPQPLGNGCTWYLAGPSSIWFATTNSFGFAAVRAPVPLDVRLRGLQLFAQAAALDPNGPYAGISLSAVRQLAIGD